MKRFILVLAVALVVPACGGGSGGSAPPPPPPVGNSSALVTDPVGVQSGSVTVNYSLLDPDADTLTIVAEYSDDGGANWSAATAAPGGDGTSGLSSSPAGDPHVFLWNSLMDGVGLAAADTDVRFRISPSDILPGIAGATTDFTVDNSANTAPAVAILQPTNGQSGLVLIDYNMTDADGSLCMITVEYSIDAGANWNAAASGPGPDGVANLLSSPGGTALRFVWNSFLNIAGAVNVRLRITPSDGQAGTPDATADFTLDNSGISAGDSVASWPLLIDPTPSWDEAQQIDYDNGYLYIGGRIEDVPGNNRQWRIEKRDAADGSLAWGLNVNPGPNDDELEFLAVQDGYLYVAGKREENPPGTDVYSIRIEKRNLSDGSLVASFGTAGVLTGPTSGFMVMSFGIDVGGLYMVAIETISASDARIYIEKRSLADGSLVASFGSGGIVTNNPTANVDGGLTVKSDGTYLYIGGAENYGVDAAFRIEKRRADTGALVAGFGTAGVVSGNLSAATDVCTSLALDGAYLYALITVETGVGTNLYNFRIEKRNVGDGALVASVVSPTVAWDAFPRSGLHVSGSAIYLTAYDGATSSDYRWRIERRNVSDLALDPSFATSGVLTIDPVVGDRDLANDAVISDGILFVCGQDTLPGSSQWRIEARFE